MTSYFNPALLLACFIMISGAVRDESDAVISDFRDVGIAHQGLGDHCSSLVLKSEARNEEDSLCKCKKYFSKVWCPGQGKAIADRKFDPKSIQADCPAGNAYCSKKESKAPRWEMTKEGNNNYITAVTNKQDSHPHEVGTLIKTHIQDELQNSDQKVPLAEPAAIQTTAVPATPTATTMVAPTTRTAEKTLTMRVEPTSKTAPAVPTTTSTTEDASRVWVVMAPRFWASTDWKCCEHSQGAEDPKIVYIKDKSKLPNKRKAYRCKTATGCGCMFGDHWHNIDHDKSPGKCRVTLAYVLNVTGWAIEEFGNYRANS